MGKERKMKANGHNVSFEKHGYRYRMYMDGSTYIGSYYPEARAFSYKEGNGPGHVESASTKLVAAYKAVAYFFREAN